MSLLEDDLQEVLEELGAIQSYREETKRHIRLEEVDRETCAECGKPLPLNGISLPCGHHVGRDCYDEWVETAGEFFDEGQVDCARCDGNNPYCNLSSPKQVIGG